MSASPFNWRDHLAVHPAAEMFPLMSENELKELGEDIKKNGMRSPVAVWEDRKGGPRFLLDGRNRLDAMEIVGLRPIDKDVWYEELRDVDPFAYVISANIHRRHLTGEQKRDLIAKLLKAKPETSNRQVATQVKVDHKTVATVRKEKEATGEIPQLRERTGKDGKARKQPAKKLRGRLKPASAQVIERCVRSVAQNIETTLGVLEDDPEYCHSLFESVRQRLTEVEQEWSLAQSATTGDGLDIPDYLKRVVS